MSMLHISYGMKQPASPHLQSECAILADLARATLPASSTPWHWYADDYDRIRDTMARVLDGFKDFNARVRRPHGFRLSQPARERGFLTPSGRAESGLAPLPDDGGPGEGSLMLETSARTVTAAAGGDPRLKGGRCPDGLGSGGGHEFAWWPSLQVLPGRAGVIQPCLLSVQDELPSDRASTCATRGHHRPERKRLTYPA
jgi:hypothetical protein